MLTVTLLLFACTSPVDRQTRASTQPLDPSAPRDPSTPPSLDRAERSSDTWDEQTDRSYTYETEWTCF